MEALKIQYPEKLGYSLRMNLKESEDYLQSYYDIIVQSMKNSFSY